MTIRNGYRPPQSPRRQCTDRTHPSRKRTEQKNSARAGADTKLLSQHGKLFQLNRGIQIEFRESPPTRRTCPSGNVSERPKRVFQMFRALFDIELKWRQSVRE